MTGRDVKHTLDLTRANKSPDELIRDLVQAEDRILITKDRGFRATHILYSKPKRLVFLTTGNIRNAQLVPLFIRNLPVLDEAFTKGDFVEFGLDGIRVQG